VNEKYVIYAIINKINGKIYIGKTKNIKERWATHKRHAKYDTYKKYPIHLAINKYGISNFVIEIIDESKLEKEAYEKEIFWIKYCLSMNKKYGYNISEGGGGCSGKQSEEIIKNKIGEKAPNVKLKEYQVKEIFEKFNSGKYSALDLAKEYNVKSTTTIRRILKKQSWKHTIYTCDNYYEISKDNELHKSGRENISKLTSKQVLEIFEKYKAGGVSQRALAEEYGVKIGAIESIFRGISWNHLKLPLHEINFKFKKPKKVKSKEQLCSEVKLLIDKKKRSKTVNSK
jgi:group I intron endonuclease